eukprot:6026572-Heterocapsa_arctica.AAC.1
MEMINSAFTSRERGRSPARFDLAAEDGAGGTPGGTDGTVGGEGNPEGDNYDGYDDDLDQFLGQNGDEDEWWNGAGNGTDPYGRWIRGAGDGNAGILRYREKDEISVPSFPTGPQVPQWRMTVAKNLAAAGGRYDQAEINWFISGGFGPGITFESLANSGGHDSARWT